MSYDLHPCLSSYLPKDLAAFALPKLLLAMQGFQLGAFARGPRIPAFSTWGRGPQAFARVFKNRVFNLGPLPGGPVPWVRGPLLGAPGLGAFACGFAAGYIKQVYYSKAVI